MDENRFIRAYKEFKCEQQRHKTVNPNNRFSCLVEDNNTVKKENRRVDCLLNRVYNVLKPECKTVTTYLPKMFPKASEPIILEIKPPNPKENISNPINIIKEKPPDFSFDSSYHFPNLLGESNIVNNPEIKMTESNIKNEMIVKSISVPIKKPVFTSLKWNNGTIIKKDIYEDGVEVEENKPRVIVQKPVYSSWASVVKPKEYVYAEKEQCEVYDDY